MAPELERYVAEREEILGRVKRLIIENLMVRRAPDEIDPDTPLFGTGLGLDSVDAVELVASVEEQFGLQLLGDGESNPAWVRTVNTLVDLVIARKRGANHG